MSQIQGRIVKEHGPVHRVVVHQVGYLVHVPRHRLLLEEAQHRVCETIRYPIMDRQ